jgi:N-acetylglutamate synthase-like GNAT family acetyltransferase
MVNGIKIYTLSQFPEYIPVIADWLYAEWHPFMSGKTIGDVIELFQKRLNTETIPITFLAFNNNDLCGTVSVTKEETLISSDKINWLSGLYVDSLSRSKGTGSLLMKKAEEIASQLSIKKIYTFTSKHNDFLQNRGWNLEEKKTLHDVDIYICNKILN